MNTKRQTIWLVSMLSLMVVLSAYYLFTDNTDELNFASETEESEQLAALNEVIVEEQPVGDELSSDIWDDTTTEVTTNEEWDPSSIEPDELAGSVVEEPEASVVNKEVLEHVQAGAKTGEEYLSALLIKRNEALTLNTERLMGITVDPEKSNDEMVKAQEELDAIEDMQYKISDLEDQLMKDFENVVIIEEKGKWKAVVQADKIERSQAVTIWDMMITNLQITPSKIAGVQFVQ